MKVYVIKRKGTNQVVREIDCNYSIYSLSDIECNATIFDLYDASKILSQETISVMNMVNDKAVIQEFPTSEFKIIELSDEATNLKDINLNNLIYKRIRIKTLIGDVIETNRITGIHLISKYIIRFDWLDHNIQGVSIKQSFDIDVAEDQIEVIGE